MNNSQLSIQELVVLTNDKLLQKRILFKKEYFNLRFQKKLGELKNTSRFSVVKKTIARINTILKLRLKTGE